MDLIKEKQNKRESTKAKTYKMQAESQTVRAEEEEDDEEHTQMHTAGMQPTKPNKQKQTKNIYEIVNE